MQKFVNDFSKWKGCGSVGRTNHWCTLALGAFSRLSIESRLGQLRSRDPTSKLAHVQLLVYRDDALRAQAMVTNRIAGRSLVLVGDAYSAHWNNRSPDLTVTSMADDFPKYLAARHGSRIPTHTLTIRSRLIWKKDADQTTATLRMTPANWSSDGPAP